jgi:hypothetical protein
LGRTFEDGVQRVVLQAEALGQVEEDQVGAPADGAQ